jgi:hypothetical protein
MGFSVIQSAENGAYMPTVNDGKIGMERLSKDVEKVANGPVNLLETMSIEILYNKTITRTSNAHRDSSATERGVIKLCISD